VWQVHHIGRARFAEIAIPLEYCGEEQVRNCLAVQADLRNRPKKQRQSN
jgi:hypothetical protein